MYMPIWKFIDVLFLKYLIIKCRFNGPVARQPAFVLMLASEYELDTTLKGTTLARTTYNDVLRVGVCPEMRPVAGPKRPKKDTNFHASN